MDKHKVVNKILDRVVNLELALELKSAGVPQKSLFFWTKLPWGYYGVCSEALHKSQRHKLLASAFLQAELEHMLPENLATDGAYGYLATFKQDNNHANTLARCLLFLIKRRIIPTPGAPGPKTAKADAVLLSSA